MFEVDESIEIFLIELALRDGSRTLRQVFDDDIANLTESNKKQIAELIYPDHPACQEGFEVEEFKAEAKDLCDRFPTMTLRDFVKRNCVQVQDVKIGDDFFFRGIRFTRVAFRGSPFHYGEDVIGYANNNIVLFSPKRFVGTNRLTS